MRIFALATAMLLIVVLVPASTPTAEASNHVPVPPFVYMAASAPGVAPTIIHGAGTSQGAAWICTDSVSSPGSVSMDITVTCNSQLLPSFEGKCIGMRVGAQSGTDPKLTATLSRLIAPVMAPPPAIWDIAAGETDMTLSGSCGTSPSAGVTFPTPGAAADSAMGQSTNTFVCKLHIDDGDLAAPWNAFCLGAP